MKTKLLKKVHAKYSWRWDRNSEQWVISNHSEKKVEHYTEAYQFVRQIAYDMIGRASWTEYKQRGYERASVKRYRKEQKIRHEHKDT